MITNVNTQDLVHPARWTLSIESYDKPGKIIPRTANQGVLSLPSCATVNNCDFVYISIHLALRARVNPRASLDSNGLILLFLDQEYKITNLIGLNIFYFTKKGYRHSKNAFKSPIHTITHTFIQVIYIATANNILLTRWTLTPLY